MGSAKSLIHSITSAVGRTGFSLDHLQGRYGIFLFPFPEGFFQNLQKRLGLLCPGYGIFSVHHKKRNPAYPDLSGLVNVPFHIRSEEHTSELQSRENLVCRLLLEKKKNT